MRKKKTKLSPRDWKRLVRLSNKVGPATFLRAAGGVVHAVMGDGDAFSRRVYAISDDIGAVESGFYDGVNSTIFGVA